MTQSNFLKAGLAGIAMALLSSQTFALDYDSLNVREKMMHRRAVEAAVWSTPLMNYKAMRDGMHEAAGLDYNDVGYFSQIQDWHAQLSTPNNTTPYIFINWNLNDGPVVIEIPRGNKDVQAFGTLMDSWQRPLADIGAKGRDHGRGGKYLIVPPHYQGDYPAGYIVLEQQTNIGYSMIRPILKDASQNNLTKAESWTKKIEVYPYSQAGNPPKTRHIDMQGKDIEGLINFDADFFKQLHAMVQEEVIEEKDLAIMGQLKSIGIEKGTEYHVSARQQEILADAAEEAHEFLKDQLFNHNTPYYYPNERKWKNLGSKPLLDTKFMWAYPNHVAIDERAATYYSAFTSVENLGAATYYLINSFDASGDMLDGSKSYKMVVPDNVPVRDFWSVIAHDADTAGWFKNQPKAGVASSAKGLITNTDGTVDVYFGPQAPKGFEANWVPTTVGKEYFLLFRFYGPNKEVFTKEWKLNDLDEIN